MFCLRGPKYEMGIDVIVDCRGQNYQHRSRFFNGGSKSNFSVQNAWHNSLAKASPFPLRRNEADRRRVLSHDRDADIASAIDNDDPNCDDADHDDRCKQLAGAFYGLSGIPAEWRGKIALGGLVKSMAEELFDMSNRVDPCPPPLPPAPSPVPSAQPNTTARAAPNDPPPEDERVTRFAVRRGGGVDGGNVEGDAGGGKGEGSGGGRAGGAYWEGGVAGHYQQLEDGYMCVGGTDRCQVATRMQRTRCHVTGCSKQCNRPASIARVRLLSVK